MARRSSSTGVDILLGRTLQNLAGGVSQQPPHIRLSNQAEEMVNCVPRVVDGVSRRAPTEYLASLISGVVPQGGWKAHIYDRDGEEQYVVLIGDGQIRVFTFDGTECTVTDTSNGYLDFDATTYLARDVFRAITVADTTWITNKKATVAMSGTPTDPRPVEFMMWFHVPQGSGITGQMTVGSTSFTWTIVTSNPASTCDNFITQFNAAGIPGTWTLTRVGGGAAGESSMVYVVQTSGTAPTKITYSDSNENTGADLFYKKVQRFSDLPDNGFDGFLMEVSGDNGDEQDDYWVMWDEEDGAWVETVAAGLDNSFDADTMPHVLVRTGVNTFDFKPYTWASREKGDEASAPEPPFVGDTIRDLVYHKDRLVLLSGESASATEAGFYDNFWPTTVTTVVDSDPFTTTGSTNRVAFLDWAIPFHLNLSLFSSRGGVQLELRGVDLVLTPKDANIVSLSEYDNSPYVGPVVAGSWLFFLQDRETATGVYEYDIKSDHAYATEITSHVPRYIPGRIRQFEASTNEQMLVMVPEVQSSTIYTYSFHFTDREEKVQSAWGKWELSEATNIIGMKWIGSSLYLVCYRANGPLIFLQRIDMRTLTDGALGFRVHLDGLKEIQGVYDAVNDVTNWTLPYGADSDETYFAILADGQWETQLGRSVPLTVNPGNPVVFASGDWSAYPAHIGHAYESYYTFSPAVVEQEKSVANASISKLQLRRWHIAFQNTAYFKVIKSRRDEDELDDVAFEERPGYAIDTYTGRTVGGFSLLLGAPRVREGVFTTGASGDAKHVRITVTSDTSYLPFTLTSAEWEGYYSQVSRQV